VIGYANILVWWFPSLRICGKLLSQYKVVVSFTNNIKLLRIYV
jgi:hypothetical protein